MDVNNINPVLLAFVNILPQIGFQTVGRKEIYLGGSVLTNKGVMINIGVVGPLKGAIIIGMDISSAKQFASKMMMGAELSEFDNIAQSALCEMSNMVCATACTNFDEMGIHGLNISPPTLLIGEGGQVKLSARSVVMMNFLADDIQVSLGVGLFNE